MEEDFGMSYITMKELSQRLGVAPVTVYAWLKCGKKNFPRPRKFGRSSRWSDDEVEAWITQQPRFGESLKG